MILDAFNTFSLNQSLAQAAGSYDSTNIIDIGEVSGVPTSAAGGGARDLGIGDDPALKVEVRTATGFAGAGASVQVLFQGAPDNGSGLPGAWSTYASSAVIPVTSLASAGRVFDIDYPRPQPGQPLPRFIKLVYVISGAAITSGTISGTIVLDRPAKPAAEYPAGINIAN